MGAMHNDLNRCSFMYDEARRCRNPQETPGASFCYYHARRKEKQEQRKDRASRLLASQALFAWLANHPLDTATQIHGAVNQLFLCVAGNLISARRADSMVRMARLMMKAVPDLRREYNDSWRSRQMRKKEDFQEEIRLLLAVVCAQHESEAGLHGAGDSPEPEGPMDPPPAKAAAVAAAA